MVEAEMWTLSDGTVVEKALMEYCLIPSTPSESLAFHMIVDPTDPVIKRLFTPSQLAEIQLSSALLLPIEDIDEHTHDLFDRLESVDTDQQLVEFISNLRYGTSDVVDWMLAFLPSWCVPFAFATLDNPC